MPLNVGLLHLPCLTARKTLSYFEGAPPLGLAYVAAAVRSAGHSISVVDALGEAVGSYSILPCAQGELFVQGLTTKEIVERIPPNLDVLGIGNLFLHELRFLQALVPLIKQRFPETVLILGGENATGMWEDLLTVLPDVTGCILGEGEQAFPHFLQVLEGGQGLENASSLAHRVKGSPHRNPRTHRIRDIDQIAWPAWDLFPVESYLEAGIRSGVNRGRSWPILTSRGCPFTCSFCSAPEMWGTTYVSRNPGMLLDEMQFLMEKYRVTNFDFRDLTAVLGKKWMRSFHAEVMARQLRFTWQIPQGTRSESLDEEVLGLMYETGCRNFGYALESVSSHVISKMQKKVVPERLFASIEQALRLPFHIEVFFIVDYPGESYRDHIAYLRAIARLAWMGAHSLGVMQFHPYPGSEDYVRLRHAGSILIDDDSYVYSSLFRAAGQPAAKYNGFPSRYLVAFQLSCLVLFWSLSFLLRPWRIFRVTRNLLQSREESIFEQFLVVKSRQWFRRPTRFAVRLLPLLASWVASLGSPA